MKKILFILAIMLVSVVNVKAQSHEDMVKCNYDKTFLLYATVIDSNLDGEIDINDVGGFYKKGTKGMMTIKFKHYGSAGNILYLTYSTTNQKAEKTVWENVMFFKKENFFLIFDCLGDKLMALSYDKEKKSYFLVGYNPQVVLGN